MGPNLFLSLIDDTVEFQNVFVPPRRGGMGQSLYIRFQLICIIADKFIKYFIFAFRIYRLWNSDYTLRNPDYMLNVTPIWHARDSCYTTADKDNSTIGGSN